MPDHNRTAAILRDFIENPVDRPRFDAFFTLCFHLARGYLAHLGRRGFRLPLEEYAGGSGLNDCTIDCLATLFVSLPGRPFYLVVDYLRGHISPEAPAADIAARLQALIAGHIRQELHRLKAAVDPQSANIRRRIRQAIRAGDYEEFEHSGQQAWAWRGAKNGRRTEMPPVDDTILYQVVSDAIYHESHMPDRCRWVFAALDADDRCQNFLIGYRFLGGMVRVLGDHGDSGPVPLPSPREVYIRSRIQSLASRAVGEAIADAFQHLATKRGLTSTEQSAYRSALVDLMADFAEDGDHDLLPQYLKERLPSAEAECYLSRHKYAWETTVACCKERLRELLRAERLAP
jgi:hypothetical protein